MPVPLVIYKRIRPFVLIASSAIYTSEDKSKERFQTGRNDTNPTVGLQVCVLVTPLPRNYGCTFTVRINV